MPRAEIQPSNHPTRPKTSTRYAGYQYLQPAAFHTSYSVQGGPPGEAADDLRFGLGQFVETGVNRLFIEIVQSHIGKQVPVLGLAGPE